MEELRLLIKSRHAILYVETHEEDRLVHLLTEVTNELQLPFFTWSVTEGLFRFNVRTPIYETQEPLKALRHILAARIAAVYLLRDFHRYLDNPEVVRALREVAQENAALDVTIVLCAPAIELPEELRTLAARYRLELPGEEEIHAAVVATLREIKARHPFRYRLTDDQFRELVRNLRGLTLGEVHNVVTACVLDDDILDASDLSRALAAKRERVEDSGVLEFCAVGDEVSPLGGLRNLKAWLHRTRAGFSERAEQMGLAPPRGVMFVGVQGCGKSLAAKTIAREWAMGLVRLDPGRLYDKYIGESEKRFRAALAAAEAVAPVVLWIDEIEKVFAGSDAAEADGGVSKRLFGSFLTWLQEKSAGVFVAATANDLSAVPPELLRKGRFDEIFFIDLPDAEERREIFNIHLTRRKQDASKFDLETLAKASEGFSGAEIEQAVVTALYGLLAENGSELTSARVLAELVRTVPLSQSRADAIEALRHFAAGRFVPAR